MRNQHRIYTTSTPTAPLYRRDRLKLDKTKITPEGHRAIVECLKIAARRGRELEMVHERAEKDKAAAARDTGVASGDEQASQALAKKDPPQEDSPPDS